MKLLVSDFDNTLFFRPKSYLDSLQFDANLKSIRDWRCQGNAFAIATGRSLSSLAAHFPEYAEFCDFLLLLDGSMLADLRKNEVRTIPIAPDVLADLIPLIPPGVARIFYSYQPGGLQYESATPSHDGTLAIRLWGSSPESLKVFQQSLQRTGQVRSFLYHTHANYDCERLVWVAPHLLELMDISSIDTGKANGVATLSELEHFDQIVVIGDDQNDVEMLRRFDGYIVQHAKPAVVAEFSHRMVTNVAELIDQLLE